MWDVLFTEVLSEVQEDDDSDDAALELPTPKVRHVIALVTPKVGPCDGAGHAQGRSM